MAFVIGQTVYVVVPGDRYDHALRRHVPSWHCLAALPARMAELERKVAGLEMALTQERRTGQ